MQDLKPRDHLQCIQYAFCLQELAKEQNDFIHILTMTDETYFHLNGFLNQRTMYPLKCTFECAVTSQKIVKESSKQMTPQ